MTLDMTAANFALDLVPQGIAVFDSRLRLVWCNRRYGLLLGLPESLLEPGCGLLDIALHLAERGDLGPGEPIALAASRISQLTSSPVTVSQRIDGRGTALEFHSSRMTDGGLVISFSDVTSRVRAERELEQVNASLEGRVAERTAALTQLNVELERARAKADAANHDKTRFLAAASHDLLQPLNAARLYTSTLIERAKSTTLSELANAIEESLTAVEDIMSALLDISRIDSGAVRPDPQPISLGEMIRRIEVEFAPMARSRGVALRVVDTALAGVSDRMMLQRVLQNLVSNAVKYTPSGGKVLVGMRRRGARIRIDVVDTGIGFNRDQHKLLFAEFSRLEQGARMAQGLGLGLSIVQRLVGALGHALELDSREGRGSRFSLLVPLHHGRLTGAGAESRAEAVVGTFDLKVLCVDNERGILDAMDGLLTHWGCEVRCALSLRQIDRDRLLDGWYPDLVLMDYHLDQTSGLDAVEWLRHTVGAHLPAALVTADRSPAVRALAEERGIAVINKPVKPAALRATISGLAGPSGRMARPP